MIHPTARLLVAIAGVAALGGVAGILVEPLWPLPLLLALLLLAAAGLDALLASRAVLAPGVQAPRGVEVGSEVAIDVAFAGGPPGRRAEVALGDLAGGGGAGGPLLELAATAAPVGGDGVARFAGRALRRGQVAMAGIDVRWQGPLGLAWRLAHVAQPAAIAITPALPAITGTGLGLDNREAAAGLRSQRDIGPGGEFEALADYQAGMERRRIDWKQSARHHRLLAREYRVERDNHVVLAFDCGRSMVEPIGALSRLDRAISAGLLTGFVSLKLGDRVSLIGFDAQVRQACALVAGPGGFAALKLAAAGLAYSGAETNFTLGLSTLAQSLQRRALIILFTDIVDPTAAELMLQSVGRLLKRHVLLCVVIRDDDLEQMAGAAPDTAEAMARAVIAAGLLRERRIVLSRLRSLGVEVLEAPWQALGPALAQRYLDTKARQLL